MARGAAITCLVQCHSFSYHLETKESQKHLAETHKLALPFVLNLYLKPSGQNWHPNFVLNKNQTSIPFLIHAKPHLDVHGSDSVGIQKSTDDTKQASLAVTVSLSSKMIPTFLNFKRYPHGWIKYKLQCIPKEELYG